MSKQLATVAAGLATTTGVGSQYMSSAGSAVTSLNATEGFSSETDGESLHQAFSTTTSTFLTEEISGATSFVNEDLSSFEVSSSFAIVSEKTATPEPVKPESAPVKTVEVKVQEAPKVEVTPVVKPEAPKAAPAPAVKQTVTKPVAVKPTAKKAAPARKPVSKKPEDVFKTLIRFQANGWGYGGWRESTWVFDWTHGNNYYKTRYLDVKRFVANVTGTTKRRGHMEVRCNKEGKNFKCWDSVERRTFDVIGY